MVILLLDMRPPEQLDQIVQDACWCDPACKKLKDNSCGEPAS